MYSTDVGEWKQVTKDGLRYNVPLDQKARSSALVQFKLWLLEKTDQKFVDVYISNNGRVKFVYEPDVALLTHDILTNHLESFKDNQLDNRALRKQLSDRGINHRNLSQWRIASAIRMVERITGDKISSPKPIEKKWSG